MIRKIRVKRTQRGVEAALPREMVERLDLGEQDELTAIETDRGILLTGSNRDLEETMTLFERVVRKFDKAFEELAR